jgi:hypothetical protein
MAVAGLGEIIGALKSGVSKYTGEILAIFMSAIDDSSVEVQSNSIYGLGLLLESTPQDLTRYYLIRKTIFDLVNIIPFLRNCSGSSLIMLGKMLGTMQLVASPG